MKQSAHRIFSHIESAQRVVGFEQSRWCGCWSSLASHPCLTPFLGYMNAALYNAHMCMNST